MGALQECEHYIEPVLSSRSSYFGDRYVWRNRTTSIPFGRLLPPLWQVTASRWSLFLPFWLWVRGRTVSALRSVIIGQTRRDRPFHGRQPEWSNRETGGILTHDFV